MAIERRNLHFESLDQIAADAQKVVSGDFSTAGTWTAGQIFEHVATTMDIMLDGTEMKTPFFIRIVGPLIKGFMIRRPMKPGFKLPKWAAEHLLPPVVSTEEGLSHLQHSCEGLNSAESLRPHPMFGVLTKSEAVQLHCRHAELHLSHIVPQQ